MYTNARSLPPLICTLLTGRALSYLSLTGVSSIFSHFLKNRNPFSEIFFKKEAQAQCCCVRQSPSSRAPSGLFRTSIEGDVTRCRIPLQCHRIGDCFQNRAMLYCRGYHTLEVVPRYVCGPFIIETATALSSLPAKVSAFLDGL